ncbi:hypothetical protein DdX_02466 [Ditylenchus destructor]|uniref:Uncharacterized protein n=1 Tax=Ditylenchus destructor TaxID=166010 RepID=A0AAD4NG72_9BILA|nr:hypothetical protein DdX_02466 [Ditylenchus destructor]
MNYLYIVAFLVINELCISSSNDAVYVRDDELNENFQFGNSEDYKWALFLIESGITAYMTLVVPNGTNGIKLKFPEGVVSTENDEEEGKVNKSVQKEILEDMKNRIFSESSSDTDDLLERIWKIGHKLQTEANALQEWAVPVIAMAHQLEGENSASSVVEAQQVFDKKRLMLGEIFARVVDIMGKVRIEPLNDIITPQTHYTELVTTYNLGRALFKYFNSANISEKTKLTEKSLSEDSECELNIGVPEPTKQHIESMIGNEDPIDKSLKLWNKLNEMMHVLVVKKKEIVKIAKGKGMSLLAKLIEEMWNIYETCW